jgi:putative transcriptional regulator
LIKAAKEARDIARGEADPRSYRVHVPETVDVVAIRKKMNMSQNEFAMRFGIPVGTLRDWEQKRREPDGAARVLMVVVDKEPEAVTRALSAA